MVKFNIYSNTHLLTFISNIRFNILFSPPCNCILKRPIKMKHCHSSVTCVSPKVSIAVKRVRNLLYIGTTPM